MPEMLAALSNIRTVEEMIAAFGDEQHCRRLLESMVWPDGRMAGSVPPADTNARLRLPAAIPASGAPDRVFINVPAAIAGSSSR